MAEGLCRDCGGVDGHAGCCPQTEIAALKVENEKLRAALVEIARFVDLAGAPTPEAEIAKESL